MIDHLVKVHKHLSEKDIKKIWSEGIFVFDSNVLLDLYRLPEDSKNDLLKVFKNENFNARIWIGFQVLLEFLNNRLTIIGEQKNMFNKVIAITEDHVRKLTEINAAYSKELEKLNLNQRHSTINPTEFIDDKRLKTSLKVFKKFQEHLSKKEKNHFDVNDEDSIKSDILEIFKNKIGEPFADADLEKYTKEGEIRYVEKLPPGYMDIKKEGVHKFKSQSYVRKFGDLYLWKEILRLSKVEKHKYVILVTGDVKEDWWEEKRGRKLGPRKELLNEIYTECQDLERFHIYNTSTFLKFAKQEIDTNIKDTSISDTQNLIDENYEKFQKNYYYKTTNNRSQIVRNHVDALKIKIEHKKNELNTIENYKNEIISDGRKSKQMPEIAEKLDMMKMNIINEIADLSSELSKSQDMQRNLFYKNRVYNSIKKNKDNL